MVKEATTLDEQISILRQRGVEIDDEKKAKECLLDIGYFRLGAYFFPFEKSYPSLKNRNHNVINGTKFSDAVALYYFDFDLRIILIRYITRIEVALRTYITYTLSNKYSNSPTWFVDPAVVSPSYINNFYSIYDDIRKKPVIKRHHAKYINDRYAPAWKTLEYMTFGNIETLYLNLKNLSDKLDICRHFGIRQTFIFENYLGIIRYIRNTCAHGGVLYDLNLPKSIKTGPAGVLTRDNDHNLYGALKIVDYFIGQVSKNRQSDMRNDISDTLDKLFYDYPSLQTIIKKTSGLLLL